MIRPIVNDSMLYPCLNSVIICPVIHKSVVSRFNVHVDELLYTVFSVLLRIIPLIKRSFLRCIIVSVDGCMSMMRLGRKFHGLIDLREINSVH